VNGHTTVLVRERWAPDDYGAKEVMAARLIQGGQKIAIISDFEFRKLLQNGQSAKVMDRVAGQPIEWFDTPPETSFKKAANISGPLDYEHSAMGRIEQGFLRKNLFGHAAEVMCVLCRRKLPRSLMVAAHIKPRSECARKERLDAVNIVFAVCLLGCDALYERGLIAVSGARDIRVSECSSKSLAKTVRAYRKMKCVAWSEANAKYFQWHFERRFQG
jgi:hypothetical protein